MLSGSFSDVVFDGRKVIGGNSFEVEFNSLTMVIGESGSGKSTLFNALTLQNHFLNSYELNGTNILGLTQEEKGFFLYNNFSYVSQAPFFLDELTIQEHIDLVRNITLTKNNIDEYIDLLDLNDTLDKFPQQLSGGEQKRASLFLSIMKDVDIFIFDEPTASLDNHNVQMIIKILNKLKVNHKVVIVFTHDQDLIDIADKIYQIHDKSLHCIKQPDSINCLTQPTQPIQKDLKKVNKIFDLMKKHQKKYKILISLFITASISIVAFGMSFNNFAYSKQQEQLNSVESNELLVFKAFPHAIHEGVADFTFGNEQLLTEEDLNKIKSIKHVETIEWRYDNQEPNYRFNEDLLTVPYAPDAPETKKSYKISILDDDKKVEEVDITEGVVNVSTYLKDKKAEKDIFLDFENDGIYISKDLGSLITETMGIKLEELKGRSLNIDLSVPIYNTFGKSQGITDDNEQIFINNITVTHEEVTLPIAGILNLSSFGIENDNSQSLYIERSTVEKLVTKHKQEGERKLYVIGSEYEKVFLNQCPTQYKDNVSRIFEDTPWQATAYSVYVDGLEYVNTVSEKLKEQGFGVKNAYIDTKTIGVSIQSMQSAFFQGAILLAVIVVSAMFVIKYNNKKIEIKTESYFKQLGLTMSEIKKINKKRYFYDFIWEILKSSIIMLVILLVLNIITMSVTMPSVLSFLIILGLSLCIHYLIPTILSKGQKND